MMKTNITARPAEAVALIGIATPVYAFLKDNGVSPALAAIVGIVCGLVPLAISTWRDTERAPGDPGDDDPEGGPPDPAVTDAPPGMKPSEIVKAERQGLDHPAMEAAISEK